MTGQGGGDADAGGTAARAAAPAVAVTTIWAGAVLALLGLVGPSWGPALVPARAQFHLGLVSAGTLFLLFGAARTVGSAAAGAASDRLPRRALLLAYAVLLVAALLTVAGAGTWGQVLAGGAALGFSFGLLATEANAVAALGGGERRARDLNLVNAAYGLGASLGPLVLGLLVAVHFGWRPVFALWAAASVVPLIGLAAVVAGLGPAAPAPAPRARPAPAAVDGAVWVLAAMAFLYNGIGWTVSAWAPTWLMTRFGAHLLTGAAASTIFYACLTAGRLADALLVARLPTARVMWVQAVAAGVALLGLALAPHAGVALVAFGAAGLALGGIYPNLVSHAAALHPDRPGAMSGLIATGGAVGVSLVPFGAGVVGRLGGAAAMGWMMPVLGLMLIGMARLALRGAGRAGARG